MRNDQFVIFLMHFLPGCNLACTFMHEKQQKPVPVQRRLNRGYHSSAAISFQPVSGKGNVTDVRSYKE